MDQDKNISDNYCITCQICNEYKPYDEFFNKFKCEDTIHQNICLICTSVPMNLRSLESELSRSGTATQ